MHAPFAIVAIVAVAAFVGMFVSVKIAQRTRRHNRKVDWPETRWRQLEIAPAIHWSIVYIRDDVGGIQKLLILTNALLTGLLAAMLLQIVR